MDFFDFFKKGEEPVKKYRDDTLGELVWNDDEESWFGSHNDLSFSVAYDRKETPDNELIAYARDFLNNTNWLNNTFDDAKSDWLSKNQSYENEINQLKLGRIHFYKYKNKNRIITDLIGGDPERSWRIEYCNKECEGLGFDS